MNNEKKNYLFNRRHLTGKVYQKQGSGEGEVLRGIMLFLLRFLDTRKLVFLASEKHRERLETESKAEERPREFLVVSDETVREIEEIDETDHVTFSRKRKCARKPEMGMQ